MHPLKELLGIVGKSNGRSSGRVVQVSAAGVHAVVGGSMKIFKRTDATNYQVGDSISAQGDVLIGRRKRNTAVKTYVI